MDKYAQQRANRLYYLSIGRCPRCGGKGRLADGRVLCVECGQKHYDEETGRRAKWNLQGACTRCGRERDGEYKLCQACRAYMSDIRRNNAENAKKRRDGLREEGMCTHCGNTWAEPGRSWCRKCLKQHKEYAQSEKYREKARARRQARIDAGMCIDCGKPTQDGKQRCKACVEARRDSSRKYRIMQKIRKEAEQARRRK